MVSACLLGIKCRYNGEAKECSTLVSKLKNFEIVAFCPECSAGLPIPRLPAEIQGENGQAVLAGTATVKMRDAMDCTAEFLQGAAKTLVLYQIKKPEMIILKANSPSCGVSQIYDGSFKGKLKSGDGVTTALLKEYGADLCSEIAILTGKISL